MQDEEALFEIDPQFEFSAPHFYDFTLHESAQQIADAEHWFATAASHGASPLSSRSKEIEAAIASCSPDYHDEVDQLDAEVSPVRDMGDAFTSTKRMSEVYYDSMDIQAQATTTVTYYDICTENAMNAFPVQTCELTDVDLHTPIKHCAMEVPTETCQNVALSSLERLPAAKRLYSDVWDKVPKTIQPVGSKVFQKSLSRQFQKPALKKGGSFIEKSIAHEDQAKKKQKLEGGRQRQIMGMKEQPKTPATVTVPRAFNFCTERRSAAHKKTIECSSISKIENLGSPFVSLAEKVRRFQMKTPDRFHNRPAGHDDQEKPKLKLTKPKEPELETSQRSRPVRVKSTAELEMDLIATMPKFKARPLNKKILEAPTLPFMQKSIPHMPEFNEFHLKTMERALQHCGASSTASTCSTDIALLTESKMHNKPLSGHWLAESKEPHLETAARARPTKVKSTDEMEQEEMEKMPKFKARPLNRKIFWSRGDLGVFRTDKRQVTTPVAFHFATDERVQHQSEPDPLDLFSKLSLNSDPHDENEPPRLTKPKPFHLVTEDRGFEKEKRLQLEIMAQELQERESRIPKANPLPYTTDYPTMPTKPEVKECTKPEPFQLLSLQRHDEELRKRAEWLRAEEEEAERRRFRAQPILNEGPVFVPERSRKPLTEVQEFSFHVDIRAVDRTEFDKKVEEKQNLYKRYREEYEAAKKADEERLIKAMRRSMVPKARPLPSFETPFLPRRSSKEPTRPRSPRLHVLHRRRSSTDKRRSLTFNIQKRCQMR